VFWHPRLIADENIGIAQEHISFLNGKRYLFSNN